MTSIEQDIMRQNLDAVTNDASKLRDDLHEWMQRHPPKRPRELSEANAIAEALRNNGLKVVVL